MIQYIPSWMDLLELGSVRELVNRKGELKALGVVYGHLPKERSVLIREIKLDENGCVTYKKNKSLVDWDNIPETIQPDELKQMHRDIQTGEIDYEW